MTTKDKWMGPVFELIYERVCSSGGDGDGTLVINNSKEVSTSQVADQFEAWSKQHSHLSKFPWERKDYGDYTSFSHGQESFVIIPPEIAGSFRKPWKDDIWLEVWA